MAGILGGYMQPPPGILGWLMQQQPGILGASGMINPAQPRPTPTPPGQPTYGQQFAGAAQALPQVPGQLLANLVEATARAGYGGVKAFGDAIEGRLDPLSDEGIARMTDLAGLITLGSGAIPAGANEARMGIKAYHGSPHDFDQFSMDKIGTGEGAQAYGHGLYMAESEGVAKNYRDQLAGNRLEFPELGTVRNQTQGDTPVIDSAIRAHASAIGVNQEFDEPVRRLLFARDTSSLIAEAIDETANDIDGAIQFLRSAAETNPQELVASYVPADVAQRVGVAYGQAADALEAMKANGLKQSSGKMYEVDINAHPDEFLDWDKPLSEQPAKVQEAFRSVAQSDFDNLVERPLALHRSTIQRGGVSPWRSEAEIRSSFTRPVETVDALSASMGAEKATEALRAAGIKGIRYLDQGSRTNVNVNDIRGTISMLETAVRKNPNDSYLAEQLASAKQKLAEADAGQTSNYVVFDDKTISILKKYGIAGLTAGGAAAGAMADPVQQALNRGEEVF